MTKHFTFQELLDHVTPESAGEWLAGRCMLTDDPEMEQFLDEAQSDQEIWDATVLCAFETTTGIDGVLNYKAFDDWLSTPAALPALTALQSARDGVWISPRDYQEAATFWENAAKASA